MQTTQGQIHQRLKRLPDTMLREVLLFIDFLLSRLNRSPSAHPSSADAFKSTQKPNQSTPSLQTLGVSENTQCLVHRQRPQTSKILASPQGPQLQQVPHPTQQPTPAPTDDRAPCIRAPRYPKNQVAPTSQP
jgi:hypothetical protein